jgi:hypothetical protein
MKTVEADFAEGDGARAGGAAKVGGNLRDLSFPRDIFVNIAGMEANGVVHAVGVGGGEGGVEFPIVGAGANGDDAGDADSGGAVEHGGEIAAAGEISEMAMGVY